MVLVAAEVDLVEASVDHHHSWEVAVEEEEATVHHFHHAVEATAAEDVVTVDAATTLTRCEGPWPTSLPSPHQLRDAHCFGSPVAMLSPGQRPSRASQGTYPRLK